MAGSLRPDTLRYSDLTCSDSDDHDETRKANISKDGDRARRRVTINVPRRASPRHALDKLAAANQYLTKENGLLREHIELKEENMKLHGVQILADVIQLLDEHHLSCAKSIIPVSPSTSTTSPPDNQQQKLHHPNSYSQQYDCDEMGYGDNHQHRVNNLSSKQFARSPSFDSVDIERAFEHSASLQIGRPKHRSTPSYQGHRNRRRGSSPSQNCNVNARQQTSPDITGLARQSLNERVLDKQQSDLRYRDEIHEKRMKHSLLSHWEKCDHRHLHVAPKNPSTLPQNTGQVTARRTPGLHIDLNKTYTICKGDNQGSLTSHTRPSASKPGAITPSIGQSSGLTKPKSESRTAEPTGAQTKTLEEMRRYMLINEKPPYHHRNDANIEKLSLLESNHKRVIGEIAFQLDKRILSFVLNGKFNRRCKYKSFYGYNVVNLQQRIIEREKGETKELMLDRYRRLMRTLQSLGYRVPYHGNTAVTLVNKYGVMKQSDKDCTIIFDVQDEGLLRSIVRQISADHEVDDICILLQCLAVLSADDGMPLFIW